MEYPFHVDSFYANENHVGTLFTFISEDIDFLFFRVVERFFKHFSVKIRMQSINLNSAVKTLLTYCVL